MQACSQIGFTQKVSPSIPLLYDKELRLHSYKEKALSTTSYGLCVYLWMWISILQLLSFEIFGFIYYSEILPICHLQSIK